MWQLLARVVKEGETVLDQVLTHSPILIGALSHCDLVLQDPYVSGQHVELQVTATTIRVRDLSTNGTFYQGQRIESLELEGQGTLTIPPFEVELCLELRTGARQTVLREGLTDSSTHKFPVLGHGRKPEDNATSESVLPPLDSGILQNAATQVLAADSDHAPRLHLVVTKGPEGLQGSRLPLAPGVSTLGRAKESELFLSTQTVSRRHASLQPLVNGTCLLIDLESANGTWIGSQRVQKTILELGQVFTVGEVDLELRSGDGAVPSPREPTPIRSSLGIGVFGVEFQPVEGFPSLGIVEIHGKVDSYNYTQLADALNQAIEDGSRYLVADLSRVEFMSHTGLAVLVKNLARLKQLGGDLWLAGLSSQLRDALSLSHVDSIFKSRVVDDSSQAIETWSRKL